MKKKKCTTALIIGLLLAFMVSQPLFAQQIYGKPDVWFSWQNSYNFHTKWALKTELHARFDNYLAEPEQLLFRPSIQYKYKDQLHFAGGYTYLHTFPYGKFPLSASRPEHNIWQQAKFLQSINKVKLVHRLRLEERFQSNWDSTNKQYTFKKIHYSTRFRYRFSVQIPMDKHWFIQIFDELWIGTGSSIGVVNFDRNWWSVGTSYKFNASLKVALSYLHQYIRHQDDLFEQHHTLQISLVTTMPS